jgi:hypothetical protein
MDPSGGIDRCAHVERFSAMMEDTAATAACDGKEIRTERQG